MLGDYIVCSSGSGDLGQVGDAKNLTAARNLAHPFTDRVGGFAADVGIYFVKDQHGHLVFLSEDGFEREHDTSKLARGGDGTKRAGWFAGVWRELEINGVEAGKA